MNKKLIMKEFIKLINDKGFMTMFIKNIFNYNYLNDYNYMFRMIDTDDEIIIDIYDNVSITRFNRYVFEFNNCDYVVKNVSEGDIFVRYISILNVEDSNNKLLKLAYLFKIDKSKMIDYVASFLDSQFVDIIKEIIK